MQEIQQETDCLCAGAGRLSRSSGRKCYQGDSLLRTSRSVTFNQKALLALFYLERCLCLEGFEPIGSSTRSS